MKQRNAAAAGGNTAIRIIQKLYIHPDTNMIKFSIHHHHQYSSAAGITTMGTYSCVSLAP